MIPNLMTRSKISTLTCLINGQSPKADRVVLFKNINNKRAGLQKNTEHLDFNKHVHMCNKRAGCYSLEDLKIGQAGQLKKSGQGRIFL